jgi:hypothetical protein
MAKTVFVLGAGASAEINMPVGSAPKDQIARLLGFTWDRYGQISDGDPVIEEAIAIYVNGQASAANNVSNRPQRAPYFSASRKASDALQYANSIDEYMHTQQDDQALQVCGKLAIVRSILEAERRSHICTEEGSRTAYESTRLGDTWYNAFYRTMVGNLNPAAAADSLSSMYFVVFNYDRCLEFFLYNALQRYHHFAPEPAAELVKRMHIYHPYGTVGLLPWLGMEAPIDYGQVPTARELLELSAQIKTFSESAHEVDGSLASARNAITNAARIVFLGFAFHRQNVELLFPEVGAPVRTTARALFGTSLGLSDSKRAALRSELENRSCIPQAKIELQPLKSAGIWQEYGHDFRIS